MEKVKYLLIVAGLFICGVMVYLMISGVHLKERRMVKWSSVESVEKAGSKIAMFMFPVLSEFNKVVIEEGALFSKNFYRSFKKRASQDQESAVIELSEDIKSGNGFIIRIINLERDDLVQKCSQGSRSHCIGVKALRKFKKKERSQAPLWISMYRLTKSHAALYYIQRSE